MFIYNLSLICYIFLQSFIVTSLLTLELFSLEKRFLGVLNPAYKAAAVQGFCGLRLRGYGNRLTFRYCFLSPLCQLPISGSA